MPVSVYTNTAACLKTGVISAFESKEYMQTPEFWRNRELLKENAVLSRCPLWA
jgi:hypothetical protein